MSSNVDPENLSDGELLRAATEGDEQAFAEFCVRSLPTFMGLLRARCRHLGLPQDLANDAGQEAILKALRWFHKNRTPPTTPAEGAPPAEPPAPPESERRPPSLSWFITIAMNVLHDWARSKQRMPNAPEERLANLTAEDMAPPAVYDDVLDALGRLPVRDREVLELVLIQELTPEEAAKELGIGKWAGYKRYERALVRLRELLASTDKPE
jgi:DNA-directed RNA polymerase specialized sigma24 family protein